MKTSTGFGPGGATVHDVELMRRTVGPAMGVKASGGIRTREDLDRMVAAGATRIGASAGVKIVKPPRIFQLGGGNRILRQPPRSSDGTTRKSVVRFQERAELLDFLLDVSDATSESLDLDRILANVAAFVKEVIPYDLFAILLYTERHRGLRIRYAIGHREEIVRNLVIPLDEGLTGARRPPAQPVMVGDVRNDPRYLTTVDAVRTELAVPMIARGKLVGVIDLQSTRLNAYKEQDRALLLLIAAAWRFPSTTPGSIAASNARTARCGRLAYLSQEFSSILALDELLRKIAKTIHA